MRSRGPNQEQAWLDDPDENPFPGPLAAMRRIRDRAALPLQGVLLTSGEVHLAHALILRVDATTGATDPSWAVSVATLARDTRMTRRGVQIALNHLLAAGIVEVEPRNVGGRQLANLYRVVVPHPDDEARWAAGSWTCGCGWAGDGTELKGGRACPRCGTTKHQRKAKNR